MVLVLLDPSPPAGVSRYRWVVLAVTFFSQLAMTGNWYLFSVILKPVDAETGWGRGPLSLAFSLMVITQSIAGPFSGSLIDRFGPRLVMTVGFLVCSLGTYLATQVGSVWLFALSFGLIVGVGVGGSGWISAGVTLSRWFPDRLAVAVGLSSAGVGIGLLVLVPAQQYLTIEYGWRTAAVAQAAFVLPMALLNLLLHRPLPTLSLASRGEPRPAVREGAASQRRDWTLRAAFASAPFWWLFFSFFCGEFTQQLLSIHQIAYLTDAGRAPLQAAFAAGLLGAVAFPAKIFWGFFADRFGRALAWSLGNATLLLAVPALALAGSSQAPWSLWLYGIVVGTGFATIGPLAAPMTADLFRGRAFGAIFGAVTISTGIGSAMGVSVAGWLFDVSGSYASALVAGGAGAALAVVAGQIALRGVPPRAPRPAPEPRTQPEVGRG